VIASRFRARAVDHLAVAIGTTKGLFFVSDGVVDGPLLAGDAVPAFAQLPDRLLAASTDSQLKPNIRASDDGGLTWGEASASPIAFPKDADIALASIWQLHVDQRPKATGAVWAGTEPAALFRSDDRGETFNLVRGLFEHPDRSTWEPGSCGLALHTVITHPLKPERIIVAISTGGVYRSDDGGETWMACNQGIEAQSHAASLPEVGPCIHKLAVDAVNPDILWAQNHSGIYRTEDAGDHWESVGHAGEPDGLPSDFGFPVVSHPDEPDTAYLLPLESELFRCTADGRCRVYRTANGGLSWEALTYGLPNTNAYLTVLRDAFTVGSNAPYPLVFGSKSGQLFASVDGGDSWRLVTSYLPPILCVRVLD